MVRAERGIQQGKDGQEALSALFSLSQELPSQAQDGARPPLRNVSTFKHGAHHLKMWLLLPWVRTGCGELHMEIQLCQARYSPYII